MLRLISSRTQPFLRNMTLLNTSNAAKLSTAAAAGEDLAQYDPEQVKYMAEECIIVDKNDNMKGSMSKVDCHRWPATCHRAFSVFLFDSENRLLLQKRAPEKILFPNRWTNTCCSHPLHVAPELEKQDNIGVKRAAVRKLEHELGISPKQMTTGDLHFMTRIYYNARCDEKWGEHEVDYILLCKKNVDYTLNLNEVCEAKYVTKQEVRDMLVAPDADEVLSPWFKKIAESANLMQWWDNLDRLHEVKGDTEIHDL